MTRWRVIVRPRDSVVERRLNAAWRMKRPVPVSRPVIPFVTDGERRFDLLRVYEAIVAAELADDVSRLPARFHKRLARYGLAGLRVVEELEIGGKRVFVRSVTGERVAAVVRSLPSDVVRSVYERLDTRSN